MAWKSFWQIRREREAEQQRHYAAFYPPPPSFPYGVEAKTIVELANKVLPEMREHHVRIAHATRTGGTGWQLKQQFKFGYLHVEDLSRLMPVDAATIARWRKRKLFYPHYGRHRSELTRETIYEDFLRTSGTSADWSYDLPRNCATATNDGHKRKIMENKNQNEELSPESLFAILPEVIRTLDGMNAQRILINPLPNGGWEFMVDQDKPLFYTLEQLSARLGISERDIKKWVRHRTITVYKPGTKLLFRLDEVLTDLARFRLRSSHDPDRNSRKLEFKVRL